jgi:hypothetical protein
MAANPDRRTFLKGAAGAAALAASEGTNPSAHAADDDAGTAYLCVTCGIQYPPSSSPPEHCPICEDERQYVGLSGQKWTTRREMQGKYKNVIKEEEPGLFSINTEPGGVGIGQRAFVVKTPAGNVLWDCVAHLDDATVARIKDLGGISVIAVSHPHYYTTMVDWSRAFGGAPIFIHRLDEKWVMRPDHCVTFWSGDSHDLVSGLKLVCTGGHFDGFQVLHWPAGAGGRGALFAGDQPQVAMDPKWVSFMYSYPNMIPLNATAIRRIKATLAAYTFDRLYGAFPQRGKGVVASDANAVVSRSADRYLRAISG